MEVNLNKISVTHVGSLPRKQEVVDFIFARENNQKYNQDDFDNVMNKAVLETVKKQVDSGVDIVSDGDPKSVNYNGLVGLLIEVVKNQQEQINELRGLLDK